MDFVIGCQRRASSAQGIKLELCLFLFFRCLPRSLGSSSSARWFPRCDAVVAIAELFAAVAAGDTVAVLLFGPLFRHAAVTVPQMFATAAAGDTVVVLLFISFDCSPSLVSCS